MVSAWVNNVQGSYGTILNAYIWKKVAAYGIQGLQFKPAQVTSGDLAYVRGKGLAVWLIRDEWKDYGPLTFAATASQDITDLGCDGLQCALSVNVESHDMDGYVLPCLQKLTQLRPGRRIVWTLEPHQGGLFTAGLVAFLVAHPRITVSPEAFYGDMTPWGGTYQQLRDDITSRGIPDAQVKVCYDGSRLSTGQPWDGVSFTLERMPAVSLLRHPRSVWRERRARPRRKGLPVRRPF